MSAKSLRRLRSQAFERQRGCCHYCHLQMWRGTLPSFPKLTPKQASFLQCTAEHLIARQDGGSDTEDNIVAACYWCNLRRHCGRQYKAPDAGKYKTRVDLLMSRGRWHPAARASTA